MGKILENMFDDYQISSEEITSEREVHGEHVKVERTAFSLLKGGKIIRVWWEQKPAPAEIMQVINQVEGAIAR